MSTGRRWSAWTVAAGLTIALVGDASEAAACGGFFCNAVTQAPIYQAGERVVFAREKDRVAMHIEIVYQGDPTTFGWVLPLADIPTDAAGVPLPLDEAVSISSGILFDRIQQQTNPLFTVQNTFESSCWDGGFGGADASGGGASDSAGPSSVPPPVVVLQEAAVGPYAAQLIQATNADALYAWLNDNGYVQDPAARPILEYYVNGKYVFLGLRLQSDKSTGDLRPVAIHQTEDAPCVPLRLTGIAATPNMPILVWVLGDARAIPKNFPHAVINDAALIFPSGTNYLAVADDAIDTLAGHAWITEFSGPASTFAKLFWAGTAAAEQELKTAPTLAAFLSAARSLALFSNADFSALLMSEVPFPDGQKGYPYGNCYYTPAYDESDFWRFGPCPSNEEHVTTEAEFYGYLDWWAGELELTADLEKLRSRVLDEIVGPLKEIQAMFDSAKTVTRFYTTQDPDQMTKDPIFAFNPDLPEVPRQHVVKTVVSCDEATQQDQITATYSTGQVHVFPCNGSCFGTPTFGPVPGAPSLFQAQVLDEWGPPRPYDPDFTQDVDAQLDYAQVGSPSLPSTYELPPAPEPDFGTPDAGPSGDGQGTLSDAAGGRGVGGPAGPDGSGSSGGSGGSGSSGGSCSASPRGGPLPWAALALALIALARRRWSGA